MVPTPPSVDMPSSVPSPEDRIRRNVACISCRNSKVRCKTSSVAGQPCQRCAKLLISCVVDKGHKRITKRSKLEQLEQELQSIKQVVNTKPAGETSWSPANSSFVEQQRHIPRQVPTPLPDPPTHSSGGSERPVKIGLTEARQLGSHVVTGADIDWYFSSFLRHYHPLLPILRKKDPDECYRVSPTLFWVIIIVAARRYPRDEQLYGILTVHLEKDIWAAISVPALKMETIHAILFLVTWPLPTIRFVTDPSTMLANIALNACLVLGLHTGTGSAREFCVGSRRELKSTNEEASSTYLACCALAQSSSTSCGHPPPSIQLNDAPCKEALDSPAWSDLVTLFNTQKFLNRLHTSMSAQISVDGHVSQAVVTTWETEFESLKPLLIHQDTRIARFTTLAAQLEIQSYYFSAPPNSPSITARLNTIKAFNTAQTIITAANDLETRSKFLTHCPHWALRTLLDAACAVLAILQSTHAPEMTLEEANALGQHGCNTVLRSSVRDADLAHRGSVILETFWTVRHLLPTIEGAPQSWASRLGAGLTFWCLNRFRVGLQDAKTNGDTASRSLETLRMQPARPEASTAAVQPGQPTDVATMIQDLDWTMFMDDFGWVGGDNTMFMGLPT